MSRKTLSSSSLGLLKQGVKKTLTRASLGLLRRENVQAQAPAAPRFVKPGGTQYDIRGLQNNNLAVILAAY